VKYRALISSDWNECLAPSGPFDPIAYAYPEMGPELSAIFREYTGNRIPLELAVRRIGGLLPEPFPMSQMDHFLETSFSIYRGVPEFIEWANSTDIIFMINTTGMQGFFQRAIEKELIPEVPLVAANPLISYPDDRNQSRYQFTVNRIQDKPWNTQAAASSVGIPSNRVIVIGDSGGDGPHFEWGSSVGALIVGSMTKVSLTKYCEEKGIQIDQRFGISYVTDETRNLEREMQFDFMDLTHIIDKFLASRP
jgi:2-hydroxy-3-keto-5-methylthiopentenyl-1-phosphate phosphatase